MIKDAQYRSRTAPTAPSPAGTDNDSEPLDSGETQDGSPAARKKWLRIGAVARRAGGDDRTPSGPHSSLDDETSSSDHFDDQTPPARRQMKRQKLVELRNDEQQPAKMMDLQYFLEMVDQKHRYGSSLRKYHNYWKSQPTSQNFFYWLDYGEGKDVELPECDRARLEREQVRYLSKEERLQYLVNVDEDGKLRWAKNGEKVWTKDALYKDSMNGIVPIDDPSPNFHYNVRPEGAESESPSSSDVNDSDEDDADHRYVNEESHEAQGASKIKEVSAAALFNHLIREHVKKGHKWIFVSLAKDDDDAVC